jgi:hypothetical protein
VNKLWKLPYARKYLDFLQFSCTFAGNVVYNIIQRLLPDQRRLERVGITSKPQTRATESVRDDRFSDASRIEAKEASSLDFDGSRRQSLIEAFAWDVARKSQASLVKAASTRGNSEVRVERFLSVDPKRTNLGNASANLGSVRVEASTYSGHRGETSPRRQQA